MRFYRLDHPDYDSDYAWSRANPINTDTGMSLPGITCSVCGQTWGGVGRHYYNIADPELRKRLNPWPLPEAEWLTLAQAVRTHIGLPNDFVFVPGDRLGPPVAELTSSRVKDFLHTGWPGVVVKAPVLEALERASLTGFTPVRLDIRWGKRVKDAHLEPPELYELVITGKGWGQGIEEQSCVKCQHCRRIGGFHWRPVDESRLDGSDFFNIDLNPMILIVTDRARDVLAQHQFTNYECLFYPHESLASSASLL